MKVKLHFQLIDFISLSLTCKKRKIRSEILGIPNLWVITSNYFIPYSDWEYSGVYK